MPAARIFSPPNRLSAIIGGAGDSTVDELVAAADARVEELGDRIRAYVREMRAVIVRIGEQPETVIFAECDALGAAALAVCEVAAAAHLDDIGAAAQGVYAMIDALHRKGVWHTEALQAHVAALVLFNAAPPPTPAQAAEVLDKLRKMRDAIGVPR